MPFTQAADGTRIHYEVAGPRDAEPLLCIQGLGTDLRGWTFQRFALGRHYRLLLVDNRGVGRSDKPSGPYDLEVMANDAVAVLDAEGIGSAHVMGASMGGVIAQIIAVRHPQRVRSLVLACTACRHQAWRRELLEGWATVAGEQGMRALAGRALRWLVGPRHRRRFGLPFNVFAPFVLNLPAGAFVSQVRAILDMPDDVRLELCNLDVPTLVVVGTQDILTPRADAEELVELIEGAELAIISGAAHGLMFDRASDFNSTVQTFLDAVTPEPEALAG